MAQIRIAMAAHNASRYVGKAIQSIREQTFPDWELVVVDDGSTDGTSSTVEKHASEDPRICLVRTEHRGQGSALSRGLEETEADYLCWVDADDMLLPEALEKTATWLDTHAECGLVYTDYRTMNEQGLDTGYGLRCNIPYSPERLLIDFMVFHFRLFRRSIYSDLGGLNLEFTRAQDHELALRFSEVTEINHLPEPLYLYREHGDSVSVKNQLEQLQFSERASREAISRRGLDSKVRLHVHYLARFKLLPR